MRRRPAPRVKLCTVDTPSTRAAFGADSSFVPGAASYRATNVASDYYEPDEIAPSGTPYGFSYDMGAPGVEDFAVLFDTNLNRTRALDLLDSMADGGYFQPGAGLNEIRLSVLAVNVDSGLLTLVRVSATPSGAGGVAFDESVAVIDPEPYAATTANMVRLALEILFLAYLVGLLVVEAQELLDEYRETSSIYGYVSDIFNVIDLGGYAIVVWVVLTWVRYARNAARFDPDAHYTGQADADAFGRILRASPALASAQRQFHHAETLADLAHEHVQAVVFATVLMACQLIKALDFHPRVGIVSRTIANAKEDLLYFCVIFLLLLFLYAWLGTLLYGNTREEFADVSASSITMLQALCGMYEDDSEAEPVNVLFYWSYMLISFFLLLNFLLAIIVEVRFAFFSSLV